jgi:heptaprenylglyceryl phosphate synthase
MLIAGLWQAMASMRSAKVVLHTFKASIRKFIGAADSVFGPGFLNMTEHHFMKKAQTVGRSWKKILGVTNAGHGMRSAK